MGDSRLNPDSSARSVNSPNPIATELPSDKLAELKIDQATYQKIIYPQLVLRAQNAHAFNQAFSSFVNFLNHTQQTNTLFNILEDVMATGIAETNLHKNKDEAVYHDSQHAAEIALDVRRLLQNYYNDAKDKTAALTTNIAVAAAACHDIVQGRSSPDKPMQNEEDSANLFAKLLEDKINAYIKPQTEYDADIINEFKRLLPFVANQLIVPSTYLLRPQFIPLIFYIHKLEDSAKMVNNPLNYVDIAAIVISFCDTNRSLLKQVVTQKILLDELAILTQNKPNMLQVMEDLFSYLGANTNEEKESLLLRLGASLRMFPELNRFRSNDNKLESTNLNTLVNQINIARNADFTELKTEGYSKYFHIYLKNIEGERAFAKALDNNYYLDMLKNKNAEDLLGNAIYEHGWTKYIEQLNQLKMFYETLNTQQREHLAGVLFTLAAKQEGVKLVGDNQSVQSHLAKAQKRYDHSSPRTPHRLFGEKITEEKIVEIPVPIKNNTHDPL